MANEPPPPEGGDKAHLVSLEKKLHVVRDHVEAIFRRYKNGFFRDCSKEGVYSCRSSGNLVC